MKAAFYNRNGPAGEVIEIGEKPMPEPGPGEVLVRLAFSGVNPSDVKSRAARPFNGAYQIPHSDGSGTIEAVARASTRRASASVSGRGMRPGSGRTARRRNTSRCRRNRR